LSVGPMPAPASCGTVPEGVDLRVPYPLPTLPLPLPLPLTSRSCGAVPEGVDLFVREEVDGAHRHLVRGRGRGRGRGRAGVRDRVRDGVRVRDRDRVRALIGTARASLSERPVTVGDSGHGMPC
jgi:hypothetical protein